MSFSENQIKGLKNIAPDLKLVQEGGYNYIFIENFKLPDGCTPERVDLLFCPTPTSGYNSRLYFSSKIEGCPNRNWNGKLRVIGINWHAFSWQTKPGLTLVENFSIHLSGLKK